MTMQLTKGQLICGLPALKVRYLLRASAGALRISRLMMRGYSKAKAHKLVHGLVEGGFVVRDSTRKEDDPCYEATDLGWDLIRASAAKRIKRKTAEKALTDFMIRVHEVNGNPHFLIRIVNVVLFGSYLDDVPDLGDLDLAYNWERKIKDRPEFKKAAQASFAATGRIDDGSGFTSVNWPETEVQLYLKNKQRTYSFCNLDTFFRMTKKKTFSYRVLLGDPDYIKARLMEASDKTSARIVAPSSPTRDSASVRFFWEVETDNQTS